jgi:hypothetical protein
VLAEPPRLDLAERSGRDALRQHVVCEQLLADALVRGGRTILIACALSTVQRDQGRERAMHGRAIEVRAREHVVEVEPAGASPRHIALLRS